MILTVTLNPAVDEEYLLPELAVGRWTEARSSQRTPGGSGVNVAIMLGQLGHDAAAIGFLAGYNGDYVRDQLRRVQVTTNFLTIDGETRNNLNIIDRSRDVETCILQPGPAVSEDALAAFLSTYKRMLSRCSAVMIGGALPPNVPTTIYRDLVLLAREAGLECYLNVEGEAQNLALEAGPLFVNTTPRHLLGAQGDRATMETCLSQVKNALAKGVSWAVANLGEEGELFGCSSGLYLASLEEEKSTRSLFTYDDAVTTGLIVATVEGKNREQVIRFAFACGLEDSRHDLKGVRSREAVESLAERVTLRAL